MAHDAAMRFSINIPNFGDFADARTVATVAAAAEQAGWDGLFVWDHVVHVKRLRQGQPFGDPWMLLTAAALFTGFNEGPDNRQSLWTCAVYLLFALTLWQARGVQSPK